MATVAGGRPVLRRPRCNASSSITSLQQTKEFRAQRRTAYFAIRIDGSPGEDLVSNPDRPSGGDELIVDAEFSLAFGSNIHPDFGLVARARRLFEIPKRQA